MRSVKAEQITKLISTLCQEANFFLPDDVLAALKEASSKEEFPLAREVLQVIIDNARIARREKIPLCQDTGIALVFLELGGEVKIVGDVIEAVNEGVSKGYREGYLRPSMVKDPFQRHNTGDNHPAVIHLDVVPGDRLRIMVAPKGAGSENGSAIRMLRPNDGIEGVKKFVLRHISEVAADACPPLIVGVGIGGSLEKAAFLAKKACLRKIGETNHDPEIARLEKDLLMAINDLGIGPQGLGGKTTALACNIETFPCHIATLPVAINMNCHCVRRAEGVL